MSFTLDIAKTQEQIDKVNIALGWRETTPTFAEAMELLISECSEVTDAWRKHGWMDMTMVAPEVPFRAERPGSPVFTRPEPRPPKPEGAGSEFADIAIRLLDDLQIFGLRLRGTQNRTWVPVRGAGTPVLEAMLNLTKLACRADDAWTVAAEPDKVRAEGYLGELWLRLLGYATTYGVNLDFEVTRKLTYNATRGWRHGGRRL